MQIAVIRHLPTKWNQRGVLQGSRDIPILPISKETEDVIKQNKKHLDLLGAPDFILTSSLIRTHETAKLYGYHSFQKEPLLDELNFGEFEGSPKSLLIQTHKRKWLEQPRDLILGEPLVEFEQRIFKFLESYKDFSNLIVFGHGSWIRALLSIKQSGSINHMNQVEVKNNDLNLLEF
ncbi:histidine phosphatase family protein [Litchfieldia alkalitelluris]|uniref:histidine phosphatase family protein n=1 Tax=Litchfieldia alkalitelluris TaxID=304268 RepID=UPI00099763B9|nr:phosphoglycerate mutase family protein [Litchfieldia alkalitelluris]